MDTFEASQSPSERTPLPQDIDLEQLATRLRAAGISLDKYGTGNAKTLEHLLSEVHEGESVLSTDNNDKLYREVNVLWVDVLCERSDGKVYLLKEDRQEFADGRIKRRELDSSIGEKLKPSEIPREAVGRALQEELGVKSVLTIHEAGYTEQTGPSDSFPGLENTYRMYKYVTLIPEEEFKPEGYVEYQADKTNYYVWSLLQNPESV